MYGLRSVGESVFCTDVSCDYIEINIYILFMSTNFFFLSLQVEPLNC